MNGVFGAHARRDHVWTWEEDGSKASNCNDWHEGSGRDSSPTSPFVYIVARLFLPL
jgi:hypothetical protein